MTEPLRWWWLSFADPHKPRGSQFLGLAIVEAVGFKEALAVTHQRGINPGGEVRGMPLKVTPEVQHQHRFLSEKEAKEIGILVHTPRIPMAPGMGES